MQRGWELLLSPTMSLVNMQACSCPTVQCVFISGTGRGHSDNCVACQYRSPTWLRWRSQWLVERLCSLLLRLGQKTPSAFQHGCDDWRKGDDTHILSLLSPCYLSLPVMYFLQPSFLRHCYGQTIQLGPKDCVAVRINYLQCGSLAPSQPLGFQGLHFCFLSLFIKLLCLLFHSTIIKSCYWVSVLCPPLLLLCALLVWCH